MEFRPCIDVHDGKVKQIVGGSLREDSRALLAENFVSEQDAAFYAALYRERGICGGHVILLNKEGSAAYEETKRQALLALRTFPGGLQVGGGITPENAEQFLDAGASHVIVTSYVFREGRIDWDRLDRMKRSVGADRLVLDLSCRRKPEGYVVVTDRWQKETEELVKEELLNALADHCDEFLVHAVDVEGKADGIEAELVKLLGGFARRQITYAGGVHSFADLSLLRRLGQDRVNVTIGSALDLFGGSMEFEKVLAFLQEQRKEAP